jgi:DNA-binding response OmpR family regulator
MKTAEVSLFIIEDDQYFRETLIDVMSLKGVKVQGAGSGAEGLAALREARPSVILLDVQLPDVHGFELCRIIKRHEDFRRTPIILLSASAMYNDPRDRAEGLLAGATMFLPKPITMDKLWAEISDLIK